MSLGPSPLLVVERVVLVSVSREEMEVCGAMSCDDEPETLLEEGTDVMATEEEKGAAEAGRMGTGAGEAALDRLGLLPKKN